MRLLRNLAVLLTLLTLGHAHADLTALGLSLREPIYVQEFWNDGKAYYRIINFADKEVAISLVAADGKKSGPFKIPARDHKSVPTPVAEVGAGGYVRFERDGQQAGALPPPMAINIPKDKGDASCMGYNGNGDHNYNLWLIQKQSTYPAGDIIEVTFLAKATEGRFEIFRTDEDDRLPHGQLYLKPINVACDTLKVEKDDKKFVVSLANPKKNVEWHRVTARFESPRVRAMKVGVIMGNFWSEAGSGGSIARAIVLVPKVDDKKAPAKDAAEVAETNKLQGVWDCYDAKTTKGHILLIHGNRIFIMPYEDDERQELMHLIVGNHMAGDTFTLEKKDDKRFIVLKTGGKLEYTIANRTLNIIQPALRKDVWGFKKICGEYKSGVR